MKKRTVSFGYTKAFQHARQRATALMQAGRVTESNALSRAIREAHRERAQALRGY